MTAMPASVIARTRRPRPPPGTRSSPECAPPRDRAAWAPRRTRSGGIRRRRGRSRCPGARRRRARKAGAWRARRWRGRGPRGAPELRRERVAPRAKRLAELGDAVLRTLERGEPGALHEGRRARRVVDEERRDLFGEGAGHDAEAQAKARHRVALREAVNDDP